MSFPLKALIAFIVWLLYALLVYNGCKDKLCCAIGGGEAGVIEEKDTTDQAKLAALPQYPLYFKWNDAQAYTNPNFDSLKQTILASMTEDNILEITGMYFESEPKPDGYENMGFARADRVKALFKGILPDDRIQLKARLVDERDGVRDNPFESAGFKWLEAEKQVAETVEELDDRIIIRFPYGSAQKEYDPAVDAYLTKLAERVKQTGETIALTGHTDNKGDEAPNVALGQRRADSIKGILVSHGTSADLISTDSKGESQPVATNDTEEGRHENRRVEVRLNKKQ
ncbi:MAG TPA: OmpA family protein [Saprospiraceae bacterium]|nr:OmpA family protein [Saprospiraceae bacterium]HMQ85442.1 OmpA family protein [Saprospiraceae bacterium]